MTTQKKKKSAKEKRVLIGSVVVAAAIVAGSTFAWFSSKDEVTNRLSASGDYNVSIVEDFQPPKDWFPGQTINKDVAAVNTGSVDAFVRMWLGGALRLLSETSQTDQVSATAANVTRGLTKVEGDTVKADIGLNYAKNGIYYKTLSTEQKYDSADVPDEETNQPAKFSEVQSMQAAGVLVYAPQNAGYHWTLEQATDLRIGTIGDYENITLERGAVVGSENSTVATNKVVGLSSDDKNYYGAIDASTFVPETTGLYLFRRNVGETPDGQPNTYEYSGYYYDADKDAYFALHTEEGKKPTTANGHSDYVLPRNAVNDNSTAVPSKDQVLPVIPSQVYLYTATEQLFQTEELTWRYDADAQKFTVTKRNNNKDISIDIQLVNIGADSEQWTAVPYENNNYRATPYRITFYYNNDVEAGDTSAKLVDSVTLSPDTETGTYLAFDFDLNVFLDSIQVTVDETGKEGNATITPVWATNADDLNRPAKGTIAAYDGPSEIDTITWTIASNPAAPTPTQGDNPENPEP